ncbi:sensor histidine kinase [Isoptericola jiangsuensis]|uniref:sensor histidine kinase n=1 Tax=Isoptericola jiangsuensis TaxID=548579 RepID=UPI001145A246|nr:sensor histidine kinase [Isoptericola jiangsuensis]
MTSHRPAASLAGGARGVELYTRVTLYLFVPLEGFFYLYPVAAVSEHPGPMPSDLALGAVAVAAIVHMGLCFATIHAGFDRPLVDGGRPHPAMVAMLGATAVLLALTVAVLPGGDGWSDARATAVGVCGAATFGALAVGFPFRRLAVAAVAVPVLVVAAAALDGDLRAGTVPVAVFLYLATLFWTGTVRLSMWVLEVVRELTAAREVAARLAVAEERLRISRDMHDVVGRALSAVAVKSDLAAALARRGDARAADEMVEVRTLAHDSLREVRGVVAGYRTADLATELAGARSVLRAAGISVRVVGDVPALDPARQEALAWVVREGVTNVVRHSRATRCRLDLDRDGDAVVLRLENDGAAPAGASTVRPGPSAGTGLTGLRERLAAVGGTLDAAAPGDSFTLTARVPAGAAA